MTVATRRAARLPLVGLFLIGAVSCGTRANPVVLTVDGAATSTVPTEVSAPPATPAATSPATTSPASTPVTTIVDGDNRAPNDGSADSEELPGPLSTSAGDERFPELGSSGIDVVHYDIDLAYAPETRRLAGTATLEVTLLETANQIALDSTIADVSGVAVDGDAADFSIEQPELIIDLGRLGAIGDTFEISVSYELLIDLGNSFVDDVGLFATDGGVWSVNEPDGLRSWIPSSDHPTDKASWTFAITVPEGLTAITNGALVGTDEVVETDLWGGDATHLALGPGRTDGALSRHLLSR